MFDQFLSKAGEMLAKGESFASRRGGASSEADLRQGRRQGDYLC